MNKKLIITFLFFSLCACQIPTYRYTSRNTGATLKDKTVVIFENGGSITNAKLVATLHNILINNGMKSIPMEEALDKISKKKVKKYDYIATIDIVKNVYQTSQTIPIYGKTGINSINTTSNGQAYTNISGDYNSNKNYNYGGYTKTGSFNGYANTNYYGNSTTKINYDYGITGYQNRIVNNFLSCVYVSIRKFDYTTKFNNLPVVHESRICVDDYSNDDEFISYIQDIYNQNVLSIDTSLDYTCQHNGLTGSCQQN
ncbi:MAG: hypothetical protein IJ660_00920 [Alphaproteobacteria bacterium]|nr:hypothetical protein [Alphaproteobacteria bacterium]